MDLTFLYYVAGLILLLVIRARVAVIIRERDIDAKVNEYIQNKSKFIRIEEIKENATPLYIAYNCLTNDFVVQGSTEDEVKTNAALKWPAFDIFVMQETPPAVRAE